MTGLRVDRMRRYVTRQAPPRFHASNCPAQQAVGRCDFCDPPRPAVKRSSNRAVVLMTERERVELSRFDLAMLRRHALYGWRDPRTGMEHIMVQHQAFAPVSEGCEPVQWALADALNLIRGWDRAMNDPVGTL